MFKQTQKTTVGLLAAGALIAGLVAPGVASAAPVACGGIAKLSVTNIQADGVPCDKARQVAKEYARKPGRDVAGFQCSHRRRGRTSYRATCTAPNGVVTFNFRK